jgi:hypothetical protein
VACSEPPGSARHNVVGTYAEFFPPRSPWGWLRLQIGQWRISWRQWRERGDGRDYRGRMVKVLSLPGPGGEVAVGDVGQVVHAQDLGDRGRTVHYIDFERVTWVLPMPSRHLELLPPG